LLPLGTASRFLGFGNQLTHGFFGKRLCLKKGGYPFPPRGTTIPLGSTWIIHWLSLWVSIETNGLIIILSTQKLIILVEDMMINPLTYPP
jgi:hypothetical protein